MICGHIHSPVIRKFGETEYLNCGDWVESCSALLEDFDGKITLLTDLANVYSTPESAEPAPESAQAGSPEPGMSGVDA